MPKAKYLFVGEKPSITAIKKGWTWESGRLAAKQLFEALLAININPKHQIFQNLWTIDDTPIELIMRDDILIVGMGKKVQDELTKQNIPHIAIIHPAARGKIRRKENYLKHIKTKLC